MSSQLERDGQLIFVDFSDYRAVDPRLDVYDADDIDDENEFGDDAAARRAAEREMDRRDRGGRRGARAARRQRVPGFMLSEDDMDDEDPDGGLLSGMKRRARRQYDERKVADDAEGLTGDVSLPQ